MRMAQMIKKYRRRYGKQFANTLLNQYAFTDIKRGHSKQTFSIIWVLLNFLGKFKADIFWKCLFIKKRIIV